MGIGIVIRDEERKNLASICVQGSNFTQSILAKYLVIWRTLEVYKEKAFNKVILEGDG